MWFIAERYLPGTDITEIRSAAGRLAAATAALGADGVEIHYLGSSFIPREESCFCRFQSDSIDAVRAACALANVDYDRILHSEELVEPDPT